MKKNASLSLVLSMVVALATGCAGPGSRGNGDDASTGLSSDDITHVVAPGDRLSDIALKYTGQVVQWEAIAAYNDVTDPLTLRIGDTLTIPASMIPAEKAPTTSSASTSTDRKKSTANQSGVATVANGTLAVQRTRELTKKQSEASDVLVAPVNSNRTFELNPLDKSSPNATYRNETSPPQIRVIGSYYPKGIYEQPASYSKLMMRVAPGTTFELEQEVNDWYKVVTDRGIGYLRMVDGTLISD